MKKEEEKTNKIKVEELWLKAKRLAAESQEYPTKQPGN
jgi:hypothetical protein